MASYLGSTSGPSAEEVVNRAFATANTATKAATTLRGIASRTLMVLKTYQMDGAAKFGEARKDDAMYRAAVLLKASEFVSKKFGENTPSMSLLGGSAESVIAQCMAIVDEILEWSVASKGSQTVIQQGATMTMPGGETAQYTYGGAVYKEPMSMGTKLALGAGALVVGFLTVKKFS